MPQATTPLRPLVGELEVLPVLLQPAPKCENRRPLIAQRQRLRDARLAGLLLVHPLRSDADAAFFPFHDGLGLMRSSHAYSNGQIKLEEVGGRAVASL